MSVTNAIESKSLPVDVWLAEHRSHGDLTTADATHLLDWYWLVCECGGRLLRRRERGW